MRQITLIGCGNIGRRHLQGILKSQFQLHIHVVENDKAMLPLALKAIEDVGITHQLVSFHTKYAEITDTQEVVIIATSAPPRLQIIQDVLHRNPPRFLILEKVLFQKISEYEMAFSLLTQYGVPAYVNCTRRYYGHYQQLRSMLQAAESLHMEVSGSNWGLACNTIHFLDLFNFLSNQIDFDFSTELLDEQIIASKRKGYIEFTGTLLSTSNPAYSFKATSLAEEGNPLCVKIYNNNSTILINETSGSLSGIENVSYDAPALSMCANRFLDDLLLTQSCKLTPFPISSKLHQSIINSYLRFLFKLQFPITDDACPIT